ncbi:MAG: alpha/beta hydrolase fold domain-containing protein [Planctomycetota bacterium]
MRDLRPILAVLVAALALLVAPAAAQDEAPPRFRAYPESPSVTRHSVTIGDETIHYTATADTLTLVDGDGDPRARIFYMAYRKIENGEAGADVAPEFADAAERPITFSFNGGPGSSSVWLHLGIFGPRRVAYADEVGNPGPPPYGVIENAHSLLDHSDFVFIDPVSTGFSRTDEGVSEKQYHGLESDTNAVADFIRLYITREQRWRSPKIIAGESYGTTRAAALAQRLYTRHGITVSGVVLVSPVLDFQTIRFGASNDLPYAMFLPTYAATAWYHDALPEQQQQRELEDLLADVRSFAAEEYMPALIHGAALDPARRQRVLERLSAFTGLSTTFLDRSHMRVSMGAFAKELLRERKKTTGRLDSRFLGIDGEHAGDSYSYDASYAAIRSNYTEALNAYVREDLGYESDLPYEILTSVWPWDYGSTGRDRYPSVSDRLRDVMHRQPHTRVFVAMGYYDLATPFYAAEHTVNTMRLDPAYRSRVDLAYYPAGHMMYIHQPSLEQLKADMDRFYLSLPR